MEKELLLSMLKAMLKIRIFEERVVELFKSGFIHGWVHSYIGEEAVATGVCLNLHKSDYITSTHRGHGHCIAKGVNLKNMMAELFGKKTGCCKGKGGSMHIADVSVGMLGANGIVGGGLGAATGAAFGCKYFKNGKIVVAFFGDGASNQGIFHESLNIASAWNLPIIYMCENNLYAETTSIKNVTNINDIAIRAKSYNIPGIIIDGMNVIEVYQKVKKVIEDFKLRSGNGPVLIEAKTYRFRGHWEGDPEIYRTKEEVNRWKKSDPIVQLVDKMMNEKIIQETDIAAIREEIACEVQDAIDFAKRSPEPEVETALEDVFFGC